MAKSIKKGGHLRRPKRRSKTMTKNGGRVRSSLKGGKKRKLKCWTKSNKKNKKYVVCTVSRGQKRKPRRSKRLRNKQRGGNFLTDGFNKVKEYFGQPKSTTDIGEPGFNAVQAAATVPEAPQALGGNPTLLTGGMAYHGRLDSPPLYR